MKKYKKYLGIPHDYQTTNCITLIADIYKNELQRDDFKKVWDYLDIKDGHPEQGSRWWRFLQLKKLLKFTKDNAVKVENLTDLQEYDVIIFSTNRREIGRAHV